MCSSFAAEFLFDETQMCCTTDHHSVVSMQSVPSPVVAERLRKNACEW